MISMVQLHPLQAMLDQKQVVALPMLTLPAAAAAGAAAVLSAGV
jgi:hypothetical protein